MAATPKRPRPDWLDSDWVEYAFDVLFENDWQTTVQWEGNKLTLITQFDGYVNVDQGIITPESIEKAWQDSYLCEHSDARLLHLEGASDEERDSLRDGLSWFTTRIAST